MLTEDDIALELLRADKFKEAYLEDKRGDDLPAQPPNGDAQENTALVLIGLFLHVILGLCSVAARYLCAHSLVALLARARLRTDRLSLEPVSCGWNAAYTNLGLALLAQNDVAGAIQCLDASWRVHPCAHNSSFGLKTRLASELNRYPEAHEQVQQYVRIGKKFALFPDSWADKVDTV